MPRLIVTPAALEDLVRLREFLLTKSKEAAQRAKVEIVKSLKSLPNYPESHRPVPDQPYHRELVIKFGASGYIARYHYRPGGDVIVLTIRHQKEDGFL